MRREVEIKGTPKEVAELLHDMDTKQIAEVFCHWDKLIQEKQKEDQEKGNMNMWYNLGDCLIWVSHETDDTDILETLRHCYVSSLSHLGLINYKSKLAE